MEDRFRKPQTAAGFEPKSRKTATAKTAATSLTKPTQKKETRKDCLQQRSDLGRPLPKASNSSRIRAQVTQNRNRKNCRNVAYKTHSKERDTKRLTPAKKTLVSKSDLGRPLPKASNSSRIRAQVSRIRAQVTQNRNRQKCRNVAYRTHSKERDKKRITPAKKTLVSKADLGRPLPKASNSSRIRAQVTQNRNRKNCRNVAYKTHSKEKDKSRNLTLEDRFRKPQTAAGFEPKSRKTATAKTAETSLTKPTQKKKTRKDCLQQRKP